MKTTRLAVVKRALLDCLAQINFANGFTTTVVPSNIHGKYDATLIDDNRDTTFPKLFVVVDSGENKPLPSSMVNRDISFLVFVYTKYINSSIPITEMTENLVDDIQVAVESDPSLGSVVNGAYVSGFISDGGILAPRGAAVVRVEVTLTSG